jgi:effector-binding domain-containing protein
MQIKAVKPINFLFFRTETSVQELSKFLLVGQELFKEAVKHDLTITGPVHWHYIGFAGDAAKPFTLEIALPVGEVPEAYDGRFHFKRTEPFRCVSEVHEGSWLDIPQSYGKLMQFIDTNHLKPLVSNREIYVNVDFRHPEANVTEIQIGIN